MSGPPSNRRVLITGLGLVSGHGLGHRVLWEALEEGRTAIGPIDAAAAPGMDASGMPCRVAACIPGLDAKEHVPKSYRKAVKVMARDTEIAVACAALAVADAGLKTRAHEGELPTYPGARLGCHIGAGLIATEVRELASAMATSATADGGLDARGWGTVAEAPGARGGMNNLQPLWLLKYLPNMLACHVTIVHGAEGPSNTITCGEASGLLSIGESARVIERGAADASLAGGAESKINLLGMVRWGLADRLAAAGADEDARAVLRPFDPASRGSLLGEGGGLLVLEEAEAARTRGARVYAEIAGFGAAQAVPDSLPYVGGSGAATASAVGDAIERALRDAGITASDVDVVVPMGLGAPADDDAERAGMAAALGNRLGQAAVLVLTPSLGNCVAGHGALAVGLAAMVVSQGTVPAGAIVELGSGSTGMGRKPRTALVCASSLGGQAAAVVVRAV